MMNYSNEECVVYPKISIITITYNSDKTLERTIQSIINQNYINLEYIIIDGGSTDGTLRIIEKYKNYISYWVSEPDDGISDAFNKGIEKATGKIIGIINSDDGLCKGALNVLAKEYEEGIDVYRGNILLWNTDTDTKVVEVPSMHFPLAGINVRICHQGTFITKNAYKKYGVYEKKCRYAMDYELLLRFEKSGAKMKYINYLMAFFTLGGLTFTPYNSERMHEDEMIIKIHGGKIWHILLFKVILYVKLILKKFINKDMRLKIKSFLFESNKEKI